LSRSPKQGVSIPVTKFVLSSNEPAVAILVPIRLLPRLMALFAVAATPSAKQPRVYETTAEEPAGPGVAKVLPITRTLRKVG
jgi:hypothetical protein